MSIKAFDIQLTIQSSSGGTRTTFLVQSTGTCELSELPTTLAIAVEKQILALGKEAAGDSTQLKTQLNDALASTQKALAENESLKAKIAELMAPPPVSQPEPVEEVACKAENDNVRVRRRHK
jgi:hypothetical protein